MVETKVITKEEAFNKQYLENKKVVLQIIPKASAMIKDPNHKGWGIWEDATIMFQLPMKAAAVGGMGELVDPFKNEEEKKYFESVFNADMNVYKEENNFWHRFKVSIKATGFVKDKGFEFDLSDPRGNLNYRIARLQPIVCDLNKEPLYHHRFRIVETDYKDKLQSINIDKDLEIMEFVVKIKNSTKQMKEFLGTYGMEYKVSRNIPQDSTDEWLKAEISKLIKSKDTVDKVYTLIKDEIVYKNKVFMYRALNAGVIFKTSTGNFKFDNSDIVYSYNELYNHLENLKSEGNEEFLKIEAIIQQQEKRK